MSPSPIAGEDAAEALVALTDPEVFPHLSAEERALTEHLGHQVRHAQHEGEVEARLGHVLGEAVQVLEDGGYDLDHFAEALATTGDLSTALDVMKLDGPIPKTIDEAISTGLRWQRVVREAEQHGDEGAA
jgi:hypothetical protein